METFFNGKFKRLISLGANCYPKFFISKVLKPVSGETDLFDFIGASMWSINALLLNDFAGLDDHRNFALVPILEGEEPVVTNTKYHLRFKHDLANAVDANKAVFKDKLARRVNRFKAGVTADSVLFIRQQEDQIRRLPYSRSNALRSEAEELDEFIDILYMKYKCKKVVVIYINLDLDGWNERHDILSVKIDRLDYEWATAHKVIQALFEQKGVVDLLR